MVVLVLDDAALEAGELQLHGLAVRVLGLDRAGVGPRDLGVDPWERQAALVVVGRVPGPRGDDRVDQHDLLVLLLGVAGLVVDQDPQLQTHLRSGQADAAALVHALEHARDDALHLVVERLDGARDLAEDGGGIEREVELEGLGHGDLGPRGPLSTG